MIDFKKRLNAKPIVKKVNPLEIYENLDRESIAGSLRPAQTRVLKKWYEEHYENKDLILKLHTGAGKTIIGLLMAMSYINNGKGPAIYVCPNHYLMQQTCSEAQKFGIPFCIIRDDNEIPNEFTEGKAILVTYVQKVFNGLSIFGIGNRCIEVGCIILDDSHACIDSIIGTCTINIDSELPEYKKIIDMFESDLREQGEGTYQELINKKKNVIMPIPYWCWHNKISEITKIISEISSNNKVKFAWPILKDHLVDCNAYISANRIEISPMCIPINCFGTFCKAKHRILMSATTQEDTFFIKGLGLTVDSVKNPLIDDDYTWSGEKMILIPSSICENIDENDIIRYLSTSERSYGIVALTPSFEKAGKYEKAGATLINKVGNNVYKLIANLKEDYKNKFVVLANRYDGIDLPDNVCRILIMDSVPYYDLLADRYEELCRATSEIIKIKTIQKIEQGLGRSVRGEKDYSVILIMGKDLIKYIRCTANKNYFSCETREQINIGFEIVDMYNEDADLSSDSQEKIKFLFSIINQCLDRDDGWKAYYSDKMSNSQISKEDRNYLYDILKLEKEAYDAALLKNYDFAADFIQKIINIVGDEEEKGWYLQIFAKYKYSVDRTEAIRCQISAFKKNNYLLKPQEGIIYSKINYGANSKRNQIIIDELKKFDDYTQFMIYLEEQLSNLNYGTHYEKFEFALYEIGKFLGYISQRPDKSIRKGPDVLWCTGCNKYVLIECKNEISDSRRTISKSEAGQMEQHCIWFEDEYGRDSEVLRIWFIPSTTTLSDDAYLSKPVYAIGKTNLYEFKRTVKSFFIEFNGLDFKTLNNNIIQEKIRSHNLHDDKYLMRFLEEIKKKE